MFCGFCIVPTNFFLGLDFQLDTESEAGSRSSTLQPPSSRHLPFSEPQTVDQTGPTAPDQLSTSDHGTGSRVLNSENQSTCVCICVCS